MGHFLYLEHFLDYLEELPGEVTRNLSLMRELDERAKSMQVQATTNAENYLVYVAKHSNELSSNEKSKQQDEIQKLLDKCIEYSEDKVKLSSQTYELVDKYIRRLDTDLARFEKDLRSICVSRTANTADKKQTLDGAGKYNQKFKKSHVMKVKKKCKKSLSLSDDRPKPAHDDNENEISVDEVEQELKPSLTPLTLPGISAPPNVLDMPVDPNEPTYCLCQQVSYGEMIGCDNPDCIIEWFHFGCVALQSKPKGKWFCPNCAPGIKKKLEKK